MFNKLKVAQAQKQIYPQSVGQTNDRPQSAILGPAVAFAQLHGVFGL
jgi:hypothetical protein